MAPESAARDSTSTAGSNPAVLAGVLEKRSGGVLGTWSSRQARLSQASLDFTAQDDTSWELAERYLLGQFDKVEASDSLDGEETEISVTVAGRLVRLRAETKEKRDAWLEAIDKACSECAAAEEPAAEVPATEEPKKAEKSGEAKRKRSVSARKKPDPQPRMRLEELYRLHFSRLERLKSLQERASQDELQKIKDEAVAAKALTRSRSAGSLNGLSASQRLHDEHKKQVERLEEMRRLQMDLEESRCKVGGPLCKSVVSPDDVTQRLYTDAVRRKQEQCVVSMVSESVARPRPGSPDPTSTSASKENTCTNGCSTRFRELYAEAQERQTRAEQRRAQHDEEELSQLAASQPKTGKALSIERIQKLHDEHEERLQRKLKAAAKKAAKEEKWLKEAQEKTIQHLRARPHSASSSSRSANKAPLWKPLERLQKPSVKSLQEKATDEPAGRAVQAKSAGDGCLMVVEHALSLRLFDHAGVSFQGADRKLLAEQLQAAVQLCREVRTQQARDPGYAALCLRPSQRLVGSLLLSDQERWSRRMVPAAHLQAETSFSTLQRAAAVAKKMLKEQLAPRMQWPSGGTVNLPAGMAAATVAYDPPCPDAASAELKASTLFSAAAGDGKYHRNMLDLARIELVCPTCDLVQAAVEQLVEKFEVIRVINRFSMPSRLAMPVVEVLLVMRVQLPDDSVVIPHICCVQLEQLVSYDHRSKFTECMGNFYTSLHRCLLPLMAQLDMDKAVQVARNALNQSLESVKLRALRCQLTRHFGACHYNIKISRFEYSKNWLANHQSPSLLTGKSQQTGSTVAAWRQSLGTSTGTLSFQKFLDACNSMQCAESCVAVWECLEANSSGVISLWDVDPEASWCLLSFRARVLEKVHGADADPFSVLASISCHVNVNTPGQLEQHEFRRVCKLLHIDAASADRIFTLLDIRGGIHHAPPARITKADVAWIMQAPKVFELQSIALHPFSSKASKPSTGAPLNSSRLSNGGCLSPMSLHTRTVPGECSEEDDENINTHGGAETLEVSHARMAEKSSRTSAAKDAVLQDGAKSGVSGQLGGEADHDASEAAEMDEVSVKDEGVQDEDEDQYNDEELGVEHAEDEEEAEALGIQDDEADSQEGGLQDEADEPELDDLGIEEDGDEEDEAPQTEEGDSDASGIDEGEDIQVEEDEEDAEIGFSPPEAGLKDDGKNGEYEDLGVYEEEEEKAEELKKNGGADAGAEEEDDEEETW